MLCFAAPVALQFGATPGPNQESAMGEPSSGTQPSLRPPEGRLDSWKEIAAYLNRDVTTVQRWEKREGMPVHRHQHGKIGSVYTFREELDAWALTRNIRPSSENGAANSAPPPSRAPLSAFLTRRAVA